jgi:hypothetical protein
VTEAANAELIEQFAEAVGTTPEEVSDRWDGRPDRIIEDLFRMPDKRGELHPLRLFKPYQHQFVHAYFFGDASTLTFLKGRRIGGSFVAMACFLLDGLTRPGAMYPIVSKKEKQAFSRINDVRVLAENAVIDIPFAKKPTQSEVVLWNGTKFVAYTGSPDSSRGDGAQSILFDEMAFMDDQQAMDDAFRPMLSLSDGKMVQVSTIFATNDLFMESVNGGSRTGFGDDGQKLGTISLYQPTFYNADEIDPEKSLYDQHLEPARPDLNIDQIEAKRSADPVGFAQEYLCRPAVEQYRFFDAQSVFRAVERGDEPGVEFGEHARAAFGGEMMMAVDVGIEHDDTAVSVYEHTENHRYLRYFEVIDEDVLARAGIVNPDRGNANHVATRLGQLYEQMGVSYLIIDSTGAGQTFPRIIEEEIGRGIIPFNFSNTKAVKQMFGEMNAALRNDRVTLTNDELLVNQLLAITRIQPKEWSTPRFTGKDFSPDGKDDVAIAAVMGAFPPGFEHTPATEVAEKPRAPPTDEGEPLADRIERTPAPTNTRPSQRSSPRKNTAPTGVFVAGSISRSYGRRYGRHDKGRY